VSEANAVEGPLYPRRSVFYTVTERMLPRLLKQFAAVLLGNLLYFFVLMPHLPSAARHTPYCLDWGLLVDLWVCLVIYGLIELIFRRKP
jgi:hypothetical protein